MSGEEWQPSGSWTRGNKLKLGLFGLNLERGLTWSDTPDVLSLEWPRILHLGQHADAIGLDVLVPVARWRGYGGRLNYPQKSFDTLCWAAGLAAATKTINVWSTVHVPTMHPLVAAKQLATIDHISGGRAGLNVVAGWIPKELAMFGAGILEHEGRYQQAEEWTAILKHLWTSDEPLDFEGELFRVVDGVSEPKPVQTPRPAIMNAGGSERGRAFAAEHADLAFIAVGEGDSAAVRRMVDEYRQYAQQQFGRSLQVWAHVNVVCRDSDADVQALRRRVLEHADWDAIRQFTDTAKKASHHHSIEEVENTLVEEIMNNPGSISERYVMGMAQPCLIGTPEHVASELSRFSECGLDGILLSFPEWEDGLERFGKRVLPLLEEAGLREPFAPELAGSHHG